MANKVAELFADFRVDFQKETLALANMALGELRLGTIAEITTLAGLTRALYNVGVSAVRTASDYHMLGEVYGINANQLQRMEVAGLAANVSVDKMRQSALGLQNNLASLNLGQINSGFLEAAGFLGLNVAPGTTEDQMMAQLFKKVPEFVKAHGAMGRPMAAQLLGQLGMSPEALQYIMAGKRFGAGEVMQDPQIAALTQVNESLGVLSRDIEFLAYDAIGPLIQSILPITQWAVSHIGPVNTGLKAAGHIGFDLGTYNLLGLYKDSVNLIRRVHASQVASSHPVRTAAPQVVHVVHGPGGPGGPGHVTYSTHVYGVEDHKIAGAVRRATTQAHERTKRDHAMHTAINNPVGQ